MIGISYNTVAYVVAFTFHNVGAYETGEQIGWGSGM